MNFKPAHPALLAALLAAACTATFAADNMFGPAPKSPTVAERLASARKAIDARDFNSAITELTAAERDEPRNFDVQNLLGFSYRKRSSPDLVKAFDHYNAALKINPRNPYVHEYIGEAYLLDRKPAEAEKHLAMLEQICGNRTCEEYQDLAKSIAAYKAKN